MNYMGYPIYRSGGNLVCKVGEVTISRFAEGERGLRAHALICEDIERECDKLKLDEQKRYAAYAKYKLRS